MGVKPFLIVGLMCKRKCAWRNAKTKITGKETTIKVYVFNPKMSWIVFTKLSNSINKIDRVKLLEKKD